MPLPAAKRAPLSILVIEDDDQLLRTLRDILRMRGYSPFTAANGQDGLDLVSREMPAIALIDLKLPDMDGVEVIDRLHELSTLTETIVLTGNASLDSAVRALRQHTADYLVKPVSPDLLMSTIERVGERWQRRQAEEALRRSEERSRLLLENMSDVVIMVDAGLVVRYVSASVERVLGFSPDDLAGHAGTDFLHPDDRERLALFTRETLALGHAPTGQDLRVRHRAGHWVLLEMTASRLVGGDDLHGLLLTGRDVTERRELEQELRQAQKLESIGRLAGGVAHDFNNILTAVIGYSGLALVRPDLDDELRRELDEIRKAGERASQLTRQLLAFARQRVGEAHVFDVSALIRELAEMLSPLIGERVALRMSLSGVTPIRANPTEVEQIVLNLVLNARDAMPGGGEIVVGTRTLPVADRPGTNQAAAGVVELSVSDSGTGMSDEVRARALEPFFTTKETNRGTGLGLATVHGIVKRVGGELKIESQLGLGTKVTVYWPCATDPALPRPAAVSSADVPRGTERVLVVDDEPMVRDFVQRALESLGYRPLAAVDAPEALSLLRRPGDQVDLVLSDVVLSGPSGDELADQIYREFPRTRVLLMSGYDEAVSEPVPGTPASLPSHARLVLQKPFTLPVLARKLRHVLDTPVGQSVSQSVGLRD